ncbi:MAG TPA: NUDIX domain-containing protein [Candidatus Saccharimonadales bacterium]
MPRQTARAVVVRYFAGEKQLLVMERYRRDEKTGELLHYYSIPGGHIEEGETAEEAALREIGEEMNIQVKLEYPLAVVHEKAGAKHIYFAATYLGGEPHLSPDSPEALHATPDNQFIPRWVPVSEAGLRANLHPVFQKLIPRIAAVANGEKHNHPWRISEISL